MSSMQKTLRKYLITTAIAGLSTVAILSLRDYWSVTEAVDKYRILADAFTVPGVILMMVSILIWLSSDGQFDGLSYAFRYAGKMLLPFLQKKNEHETYYDYKRSREGKRLHGFSFLFFVGLAFVLIAIVFVWLHSTVYVPKV